MFFYYNFDNDTLNCYFQNIVIDCENSKNKVSRGQFEINSLGTIFQNCKLYQWII